jgi:Flp pilus assembly pilin Flp
LKLLGRALQTPHESDGQSLVEYSMIILLVALVCVVALATLGDVMIDVFWNRIVNELIPFLGG